jgi:hypothetical protein
MIKIETGVELRFQDAAVIEVVPVDPDFSDDNFGEVFLRDLVRNYIDDVKGFGDDSIKELNDIKSEFESCLRIIVDSILEESEPNTKFSCMVEEDPETGEAIIQLPEEKMKEMDWRAGDSLQYTLTENKQVEIRNISREQRQQNAKED